MKAPQLGLLALIIAGCSLLALGAAGCAHAGRIHGAILAADDVAKRVHACLQAIGINKAVRRAPTLTHVSDAIHGADECTKEAVRAIVSMCDSGVVPDGALCAAAAAQK